MEMKIMQTGHSTIKEFGGEKLNITCIEEWTELTARQQNYLSIYVDNMMQETATRLVAGVKRSELETWKKDTIFLSALKDVEELFTEGLRAVDYQEALTNSKIRGRVLQAREAKGYEKKQNGSTTNNVISTSESGLAGLLSAIKGS